MHDDLTMTEETSGGHQEGGLGGLVATYVGHVQQRRAQRKQGAGGVEELDAPAEQVDLGTPRGGDPRRPRAALAANGSASLGTRLAAATDDAFNACAEEVLGRIR